MKKSKKSIYERTWFFYKGALIIKAPKIVDLMMLVSRTDSSKRLEACAFLPGIVFVDSSKNYVHYLCNHEAIHVRQVWECMLLALCAVWFFQIPMYLGVPLILMSFQILYLTDFTVTRAFLGHHDAYLSSSFEQEAWLNENNRRYLKTRIPFIWMWYMLKNIFLLPVRRYRVPLLKKLVHIRTVRKQYHYWSCKKNHPYTNNWTESYLNQLEQLKNNK